MRRRDLIAALSTAALAGVPAMAETAKALGLIVPQTLLARADEVIE